MGSQSPDDSDGADEDPRSADGNAAPDDAGHGEDAAPDGERHGGDAGPEKWHYRAIARNVPNGAVALFDHDLRYTFVDGLVFDDLDIDPDDLEGRRLADVHSESFRVAVLPDYRAALDGEMTDFEFEYDGRVFRGFALPIRDESGTVVAGLAMTQDVTEEVSRQRELEAKTANLEQFARIVSHDLRTPLNLVRGNLELIETDDTDRVERALAALDRIETILEDTRDLALYGRTIDRTEPVDLAAAATESWAAVGGESADATLRVDVDGRIEADPTRLRGLLENLLSNALDHAGPGVTVAVEPTADGFAVVDDGPGIPSGRRRDVFEPGHTTREEGTGFGLAIVESIAEAHGWRITATEAPGGGARFEVTGVERPDEAE